MIFPLTAESFSSLASNPWMRGRELNPRSLAYETKLNTHSPRYNKCMVLDDGIEPPFSAYQTEVIYHYTNRAWYLVLESNQRFRHVKAVLIPSANQAWNW